jgi:hydrogenase maturation protease
MWNLSTKSVSSENRFEWQVVGLGSSLGSDDGIGLALVQALSGDAIFAARCVFLESADAATIASSLIEWGAPVILVDAANMALSPGQYRLFEDSEASAILKTSSVSTHGLGLAEGLELARTLGFGKSVYIFGIQPFDLSPGQGLTPEMTARFPSLLSALRVSCSRLIQV